MKRVFAPLAAAATAAVVIVAAATSPSFAGRQDCTVYNHSAPPSQFNLVCHSEDNPAHRHAR